MSTRTPVTRPATRRVCAGEYVATDRSGREWTISRVSFGHGHEWVAACTDERGVYLDPMPTLGRAAAAVCACEA